MKMICPKCGKEYNERMTCCISCGAELVPIASEQTAFEPIIPEAVPDTAESGFTRNLAGHSEFPPEEPEEAEIPVPVSVKGRGNAARGIGSFAAAVVMTALIILSAASFAARLLTDSGKISEFAHDLDVMSLPAGNSPDETVQETIFAMSAGTGLTREDIRKIYENSTAEDFLADQLNGYAEFIRQGELPEKLTSDKLKAVFSENIGLISDTMGKPMSQSDIDLAFSHLEQAETVLEAISPSEIEKAAGDGALTALRLFCSLPVMIGEACAAAVMLIVLWAVNGRPEKVLSWGGGAVITGGSAVLLTAFLCSVLPIGQDRLERSIIKCVTDVINPDLYRLGGTLAVIGIIMLVWSATLKAVKSQKYAVREQNGKQFHNF